jgi:glutamyl/glutaminyl-tRNA synthetase
VKTRFAPAPTGYLHLGHVVNAIYVWGIAGARRGSVVLRIEDHDWQRSRPVFESALLDDLDWLGFRPDIYPTDAFRQGACEGRQSDRDAIYHAKASALIERGMVYACDCTRRQLETSAYPGTCRDRGLPLGEGVGWRLRVDDREETFLDERLGAQRQRPAAQCGDLLIRDRLGNWTYQWVVATDDSLQDITHVIRGEDLLDSTGRQIYVARVLGRISPPAFLHHPLVMKSPTQKVSKSDGDTGIRDLRAAGWTAARVIAHAAALIGLQAGREGIAADQVCELFEGGQSFIIDNK